MHRARLITLVVALAAFIAVAAVAEAAPRSGYYIDPGFQVYIKTKGNKIKSLQAACTVDGAPAGGFVVKGIKIKKKGKFHFHGKVKLNGSKAGVDIKGQIKKTATGFITWDEGTTCENVIFNAAYAGKHPQG